MDGRTDGRMDGRLDGRMHGWINGPAGKGTTKEVNTYEFFFLQKQRKRSVRMPITTTAPAILTDNNTVSSLLLPILSSECWNLTKKKLTWAYHTNILLVGTGSVTPARVRAFNKSGFAAITVHLIHPNTAASRPKTLKSLPDACETKFIANNVSVFFFPIVITNCSPFPLVEHLNTSFILRATTTQTNVAFGSSLCYNINTFFFCWTSVIPQRTMYKINGFHDFWRSTTRA